MNITQANNKLPGIQFLRAIAALLVVIYHINEFIIPKGYNVQVIKHFFYSGVDLFFVISGFIITYVSYEKFGKREYIRIFLIKRFNRILPSYWICILLAFLVDCTFTKVLVSKNITFSNLFPLSPQQEENFLPIFWTLSYELYFYFIFSFLLFFISIKNILLTLSTGVFLLYFAQSYYLQELDNANGKITPILFFLSPFLIEFFMGAIAGVLVRKNEFINPKLGIFFSIIILLFALIGFEYFFKTNLNHSLNYIFRVLLYGVSYFFLVWSLAQINKIKNIFLKLGDASYSIYLLHSILIPVVYKFLAIFERIFHSNQILFYILYGIVTLITIIILGLIYYNKIEKPLINYLNKKLIKG